MVHTAVIVLPRDAFLSCSTLRNKIVEQFEPPFHRSCMCKNHQNVSTISSYNLKNLDTAGLLNPIALAKDVGSGALCEIDGLYFRNA